MNRHDVGHLIVSVDGGATFREAGLHTSAPVWRVVWLPRARQVCVGGREGLFCGDGSSMERVLSGVDVYFAAETRDGVLAGGYPSILLGDRDARGFEGPRRVGYAVTDAVRVGERVFRGGDALYVSDDDGRRDQRHGGCDFGVRVLAANGRRVYAAGGTFGGSFARSDDGGDHWREMSFPGSQPEALWVDPSNPDVVLVGTHGDVRRGDVLLTVDGGGSWRALGCPGAEVHAVAVDARYVYCGATSLVGASGLWRLPLAGIIPGR